MTSQMIVESGMSFGPYPEGHCFYIEKAETYKTIQDKVPIAEFLLLRTRKGKTPAIWILEAKSSTPRPESQPNFDEFINDIKNKLLNAFSMGMAFYLNRFPRNKDEFPEPFKKLDFSNVDFKFLLVINGHKDSWLPPIQDALKKSLHATIKTWKLSSMPVLVINDVLAKKYGLIRYGRGYDQYGKIS